MTKLLFLLCLFVSQTVAFNLTLQQPHSRLALFDGLTCSTCEGVMNIVNKQLPDVSGVGKEALKLAVKGACAYYTLGVPIAIPLCNAMTDKLVGFLAEDVVGRTMSVIPKSNCRTIGMCPPCATKASKLVLATKQKPNLPLPWDNHNKIMHPQMHKKYQAELAAKRKAHGEQYKRNFAKLAPARQKALLDGVSCYACKSVLGMVGHDITNVKLAGRDLVVNAIKSQCKSYSFGMPFADTLCDKMANGMVDKLAGEILSKNAILPGPQCRTINMCPPCPNGKCDDEIEVEKGKEAAKKGTGVALPDKDTSCDEPAPNEGKPCTDNYPARCTGSKTTCENSVYERMMAMECMFTCICSWLPWFKG